jgi:hypothetical protein
MTILWEVLWGVLRGGRRATIRLAFLVLFGVIAFFITPPITRAILGIDALVGLVDSMAGGYVPGGELAGDMLMLGMGVVGAIVNILVFLVLFYVMKFLSWIAYAIAVIWLAPKYRNRDKSQGKNKKYRWWGVGMGVATGFVTCIVFMIPFGGLMVTVDKVDQVISVVQSISFGNSGDGDTSGGSMGKFADAGDGFVGSEGEGSFLSGINKAVNQSAFGYFTKYTGLQSMGTLGARYLMTIRVDGQTLSIIGTLNEVIAIIEDVEWLVDKLFSGDGDILENLQGLTPAERTKMQAIINDVLGTSIVEFIGGFVDVIIEVMEELMPDLFDMPIVGPLLHDIKVAEDLNIITELTAIVNLAFNAIDDVLKLLDGAIADVNPTTVGALFNRVLNDSALSRSIRNIIYPMMEEMLDELFGDGLSGDATIDGFIQDVIDALLEGLCPELPLTKVNWTAQINVAISLLDMIDELEKLTNIGDGDISGIANTITSIINAITADPNSPIAEPLVKLVVDMIDDLAGPEISISVNNDADFGLALGAIKSIVDVAAGALAGEPIDLDDIFEEREVLESLALSGAFSIVIADPTMKSDVESFINTEFAGPENAELLAAIKLMLNLGA